jgi:O-antigen/teichoic acid export membrane protein
MFMGALRLPEIGPSHLVYGVAFFTQFLLAKLLLLSANTEWFGAYSLFLSCAVAARICWFGVVGPAMALDIQNQQLRMTNIVKWLVLLPVFAGVIIIAFASFLTPNLLGRIASGVIFSISLGLCSGLVEIFNAQKRTFLTVLLMILPAAAQLIVSIALLFQLLTPEQFALCVGLWVMVVLLILWSCWPKQRKNYGKTKGLASRYFSKMLVWIPANLMMRFVDKWVVLALLSLNEITLFALFLLLSQAPMSALASLLQRVMQPTLYGTSEIELKRKIVVDALAILAVVAGLLFGVTCGFHVRIVGFFAPEFVSLSYLLPLAIIGAPAGAATHIFTQFAMALARFEVVTRSKYLEALSYLVLLFAFTPKFGVTGVFAAFVISSLCGFLVQVFGLWQPLRVGKIALIGRTAK